jgi:hypothetical protein
MKTNKALLLAAGLGAFAATSIGGVAVAAPKGSLEDVVAALQAVLSVQVVNSEPLRVNQVATEEPITLEFGSDTPNYVVPEGKLLVIQAVSFDVNADDLPFIENPPHGTIVVATFDRPNSDLKFFFFPVDHRVDTKWVGGGQTTIYAVAGKEVSGDITPFAFNSRVTVSGVLRNAP